MKSTVSLRNGYTDEDLHTYSERETQKENAYIDQGSDDENLTLDCFERVIGARHARVILRHRPDLEEYFQETVRSKVLLKEDIAKEILAKHPPATGKIKMLPGHSGWYKKGVPKQEFRNHWMQLHVVRRWAAKGVSLEPPTALMDNCR